MYNKILWTIDNELDGKTFERLCTDLLYREGYKDIIPIGGNYDNGRDAEIRKLKGKNQLSEITFFQYSLEKNWLKKIEREIEKTFAKHSNVTNYVFVTSCKITGNKRDILSNEVCEKYKCNLILYDREWLRTRLETASNDLARKYLNISAEDYEIENYVIDILIPADQITDLAWKYYKTKNYEFAISAFKDLLLTNPNHPQILLALSWSLYLNFRYDEAIYYINKAIEAMGYTYNTMAIKACIFAEYGIKQNSREYLLVAKDIFKKLAGDVNRAIDHYNFGNTLSALCQFEDARKEYLLAIRKNPKRAETWKNLGSVYDHLGNHSESLKCYDKALEINPSLPQALTSKAIILLKHHNKPNQSLKLIEKALSLDDKIYFKWPLVFFWYAEALIRMNKTKRALEKINEGLDHTPDSVYLLRQKANLLFKNWVKDSSYIDEAISFCKHLLNLYKDDKKAVIELLKIYSKMEDQENYWLLLEDYFKLQKIKLKNNFTIEGMEHVTENTIRYYDIYKEFRTFLPINPYIDKDDFKNFNRVPELSELLFVCYLIPFSFICSYFIDRFINKSKRHSKVYFRNRILSNFRYAINVVSKFYLKNLDTKDIAHKIESLSFNIVHWPLYSSIELSNQVGFLCGYLKISKDNVVIINNELFNSGKLNQDLMISNLNNLKDEFALLRKEYRLQKN